MNNTTVTFYEQLVGKLKTSEEFPVEQDPTDGRYIVPDFFGDKAEVSPIDAVGRKVTRAITTDGPEMTREE